ncbi:hypothetical protein BKA56DRAFT_614949 [Ilyonectria sp. MPI-CAGE-AT-0026]|nr:hypothetical protein BKA56DRAFT_614949 [Ilyonectria sp. MPI-CAGE-AT-0026]
MATASPMQPGSPRNSSLTPAAVSTNTSPVPTVPSMELPVIRFTTIEKLFDEINRTTGDVLTVCGVSVQQFAEIEKAREGQRRKFRFRRFSAAAKILIITIPTRVHEILHSYIFGRTIIAVDKMGLDDAWVATGDTTFRAQYQHPNGDGGEGDSTGCPSPARDDGWPTLVIEAGYSQTLQGLRQDMEWWFRASRHEVKIVLLAKFDRPTRSIILEKWVEVVQTREGATNTRAAAEPQPARDQVITITQNPGNPVSYNITSGDLRLEFRLLFLRLPTGAEQDIIIDAQRLRQYAAKVWTAVR